MGGAGYLAHLQFYQALRGIADHLAQGAEVETLFQQLARDNPVVGHRG
jgi:hypothetical protein